MVTCAATRSGPGSENLALGELDARRLYLGEGCSSLFAYCTQVLHLSEHAAYGRIEAARAARQWPIVLDLLADGSLHEFRTDISFAELLFIHREAAVDYCMLKN
jgi:hypothetical protein